ncbi:MAG: oligosaccharide flippase family protein [Clostridium sp.]|nr:oligosaccharide flippase family protein [Clostridium sp.]
MSLFKKFITFAMGNGIVFILSFISTPIITRIIDADNMGKFSMFTTIGTLILLITMLGLDQTYVRYYYEETEENRGELLKKCIKIPIICWLVVSAILIIFFKPVSRFIIGKTSFVLVVLLVIHIFSTILTRFTLLEIRMKQKAKLYSTLSVVLKLGYVVSVLVLFFAFKNNYITLILATILSNIVMALVGIFIERDAWKPNSYKAKIQLKNEELIRYGIPFIFSMAITWIFQSIDKVTIRAFCGYSEVGLYAGAMTIIAILNTVQDAFSVFWVPVAYEHYSKDEKDTDFFRKINNIVSLIMLLGAIILIAFKDVIILFLGPGYREAVFILPFLVFMPVMSCISETTVIGINFKKKTKNHIVIAVISAATNLVGNLLLVPSLGAKGAAISTGLSYVVFFLARTIISKKYYNVNYNLGKIMSCIFFIYILAIYASFHKFNIIIMTMAVFCTILVIATYKGIIGEGLRQIKGKN